MFLDNVQELFRCNYVSMMRLILIMSFEGLSYCHVSSWISKLDVITLLNH